MTQTDQTDGMPGTLPDGRRLVSRVLGYAVKRMAKSQWRLSPAVSTERLSLTPAGTIRYRLKTPYRDGTTDIVFEPMDVMGHIPVPHPPARR